MTTLNNHLEQISLCSKSIAEIEFPPPRIFTNALLGDYEITTLIRDTEPHERALFSLDPAVTTDFPSRRVTQSSSVLNGENGVYGRKSFYGRSQPLKQSAVARVLGSEMLHEIRESSKNDQSKGNGANIEILLRGAEKLCEVYSVADVQQKIAALRNRYRHISASVSSYEEMVMDQQLRLNRVNQGSDYNDNMQNLERKKPGSEVTEKTTFTEQDFQLEEEVIRDLEIRKKTLEGRVAEMEKDLGGLLR